MHSKFYSQTTIPWMSLLKIAATKEKLDLIQSVVRDNITEFNQENFFTLEGKKNLSKISKILEKITVNDT